MPAQAVDISHLTYRYGQRCALDALSLQISAGEIFALLGPNGSGKTTLFRLLSTLIPIQEGEISILGHDLRRETDRVRALLGVVFQSPSLDKKLTVAENIRHQARLYGLSRGELRERQDELFARLRLTDRANERVETLSGGLRRRVELAKGMLHRPRVLILDEPSTGLDPGARTDLWDYLRFLRQENGVTVVLTTHLLEEADHADRIAIVHDGRIVALDTPEALRATVGGDTITIETEQPLELAAAIAERFGCATRELAGTVRLEQTQGHQWIPRIVEAFPDQISSITLGRPTLEDVFIARTGHRFWNETTES